MTPDDPVPPLPMLLHGDRVAVVDAKFPPGLRWVGATGTISRHKLGHSPLVIVDGDRQARRWPIDYSGAQCVPTSLIVEPLTR